MAKLEMKVGRHSDRFLRYILKFKRNRNTSDGDILFQEAAKQELLNLERVPQKVKRK